jgi:mono/diheme cytochrome c family protein
MVAVVVFFAGISGSTAVQAAGDSEAAKPQFYTEKIQPIFASNCYRCHGGMNHRGGLSLASPTTILRGGKDGVVIVPGDPANSLLVKLIRHEGPASDPRPMPPKAKLSDADIATVERWVRAGAIMPAGAPQP